MRIVRIFMHNICVNICVIYLYVIYAYIFWYKYAQTMVKYGKNNVKRAKKPLPCRMIALKDTCSTYTEQQQHV